MLWPHNGQMVSGLVFGIQCHVCFGPIFHQCVQFLVDIVRMTFDDFFFSNLLKSHPGFPVSPLSQDPLGSLKARVLPHVLPHVHSEIVKHPPKTPQVHGPRRIFPSPAPRRPRPRPQGMNCIGTWESRPRPCPRCDGPGPQDDGYQLLI